MKYRNYFLVSLIIIIVDQVVKLAVHEYMIQGSNGQIKIFGDWFKLHYTVNPGMAFGMVFGGKYGKLALSLFSIFAMFGIGFYLYSLISKQLNKWLCLCVALIFGGAVGNIIDRTFYGIWLDNAPDDSILALFHGQVIDMFYLDLWEGVLPYWIPVFGGEYYSFWPIFNIADASIFTGITTIMIFQKKFFVEKTIEEIQDLSTIPDSEEIIQTNGVEPEIKEE